MQSVQCIVSCLGSIALQRAIAAHSKKDVPCTSKSYCYTPKSKDDVLLKEWAEQPDYQRTLGMCAERHVRIVFIVGRRF